MVTFILFFDDFGRFCCFPHMDQDRCSLKHTSGEAFDGVRLSNTPNLSERNE